MIKDYYSEVKFVKNLLKEMMYNDTELSGFELSHTQYLLGYFE